MKRIHNIKDLDEGALRQAVASLLRSFSFSAKKGYAAGSLFFQQLILPLLNEIVVDEDIDSDFHKNFLTAIMDCVGNELD